MLELATSHWPLRDRHSLDRDVHARRLSCYVGLLRNGFGVSDDTAGDETLATLLLAREYENRVTFGDLLAAIHPRERTLGDLNKLQQSVIATTEETLELIEREQFQDLGCGSVD